MTIEYKDSKRISALSTDTYTTTTTYDHLTITGTESSRIATGYYLREGVKILTGSPAIGTQILNVEMSLRKIGSPTGNLTYVVRDATDSVVGTSGTLDVSTLTGSFADYELSFSSPVTLGVDYHVAIEYNGGGVSDYLAIELKNETSETGYSWSQYTSSWSELTSYNIAITFDSNPTTVTKPTNVQDNSILVEKDTGRRYWFDDAFNLSGLKAYYKFDETSGNLINQSTSVGSADSLGTNADGTAGGNPTYSETGVIDSAINFDGVGDYFELGSSNSQWNFLHNDSAHWTLSFWMKLNSIEHGGIDGIMGTHAYSASSNVGMGLFLRDDGANDHMLEVQIGNLNANPAPFTSSASYIPKNTTTWYHYIITNDYDGTNNINIYRDNANNESGTIAGTNTNGNSDHSMLLALDAVAQGRFSDCLFDEFSMWDRVITADERASLYNSGTGNTVDTAKGATWTMEPTWRDDFSTIKGWVSSDTAQNNVNIANQNMDCGFPTDTTNNAISYDLTSTSDSAWVCRFKIRFSALSLGAQANWWAGLSSLDSSSNSGASHDFIGIQTDNANYGSQEKDGQALTGEAGQNNQALSWAIDTDYYFEITRLTTTTFQVKLFSDSAYSTQVGSTSSGTCPSGVTSLRYIKFTNAITSGSGDWTGTIDDVEFYNGVTTVN